MSPRTARRVIFGLVATFLLPALGGAVEPVRIGVVVDGPWPLNDTIRALTLREILVLTEGEFDVRFPAEKYLVGDWTLETVTQLTRQLLDDPEVDLVITWGLLGSHSVCCLGDLAKPVIAPVVIDPALQGLPLEGGVSGVPNLNYVALPDALAEELASFRAIVPFDHIAILTNEPLLEAIPELVDRTRAGLAASAVEFDYVPVAGSAAAALAAIPAAADAVYVWPLFQFSPAEYRRLIDGFIERGLPSFSGLGGEDVRNGMLASVGSEDFFPKLARRVALNVQRILLGEEPGEIPVGFTMRRELTINMATARAIDVSPRWEVLIEADLLFAEDLAGAYELSLDTAMDEAIRLNLDLLAAQRAIEAGAEDVGKARAALKPSLSLEGSWLSIDADRAAASLGSQAERTTSAGAELSQLVYSEPALANLRIQRELQIGREHEYATLEQDIALEAGTTYLNLLRARALERVRHNDVDRTRSNLETSQARREIGAAAAGEVLRWESQIASARKSLIEAVADRRSAELAVNRLLHRPLDAAFVAADVGLEDLGVLTGIDRFLQYLQTPRSYAAFADFVVTEGLGRASELARLDAALRAQNRFRLSAERAFRSPSVGLSASFEETLSRGGAGTQAPTGLPFTLPQADDSSWSLALQASWAFFAGGGRAAERTQAERELEQLSLERAAIEERLEQRMRTALEQARASLVGIRLSNQAADAARGNFELVNDAYARGAASLLDLLDAQTASLNAEEEAANALYDFLIDWLEAKRSASALDLLIEEEERDAWLARLDEHMGRLGLVFSAPDRSWIDQGKRGNGVE